MSEPLHTVTLPGCMTEGVGFTVMLNVLDGPGQVSAVGVTVIVAVTGDDVTLTAVNEAMSPVPLAVRPIDVVLFVQL